MHPWGDEKKNTFVGAGWIALLELKISKECFPLNVSMSTSVCDSVIESLLDYKDSPSDGGYHILYGRINLA